MSVYMLPSRSVFSLAIRQAQKFTDSVMDFITASLVTVVCVLIFVYKERSSLPGFSSIPGPPRLPIFGNVQCQFKRLHMQFTEWSRQYGDVFKIHILTQPAIVINSYEAMREAYVKRGRDFNGRPHMLRFEVIGANKGVAFRQYSEKQQKLRTKASKALSLQGAGLLHLENLIVEQLQDLVDMIKTQKEQAFNPKMLIKKFLINVIMTLIFGEKLELDDPLLEGIAEFNNAGVEAATIGREDIDVWEWTKFLGNPNYTLSVKAREALVKNVIPLYQKYKDTYIPGHERGMIDKYITDVHEGVMTDEDVHGCLIDFFIGGVETTSTTLYGFLLILLNTPKVQEKIQNDVDDVIGKDRTPSLSDKQALPYAEACLLELFRYQSSLPILVPREAIIDTEVAGYKIPKGTWVYTNSWAIHHNEEVYESPMEYKPERFLDDDGNLLPADHPRRKHIVTFGLGGRHCIGEQLAKSRLFLTLCTLMQQFTFEPDQNYPPPSHDARNYKLKIIFDIDDYKLRAIPRL